MRKFFAIMLCVWSLHAAAISVQQVEPLSWWTDMQCPLTLLVHGEDLASTQLTVQRLNKNKVMKGECTGLQVMGQHNAQSPNYLFIDMAVNEAGTYRITLSKAGRKTSFDYTIQPRREGSRERQSFTSADMIYLIMSDRFVDGDPANNSTATTREKADKKNVHGRFGGDIQGIVQSFDHIISTGATAIWATPLLLDDEAEWSYHGYACADYYHIDPRMGSNEQYRQMVQTAHEKGLKILMDMVPNHCGAAHWWMKDLPYPDWINQHPSFTNTNNCFSANYDINAAEYDRQLSNSGWFDKPMPDMNLNNEDLLQYFIQWAIWWIEYADLDGLRVDTYPYIEPEPAARWCQAIRNEYPDLNIVGECWTRPASAVAYWQSGTKNFNGFDSHLPAVMDFPVEEAIRQALENDGNYWGGGLTKVYDAVAMDYLYADVNNLLLFLGNHDMDRFADIVLDQSRDRVKLGMVLLATLRGIPQLFYGEEYNLHSADRSLGHSTLRMPLPDSTALTEENKDMMQFVSRLFTWRKTQPIIHFGKTKHFLARDNTYAFFRYTNKGAVFVYANASNETRTIPTEHYAEMWEDYRTVGNDVLTGQRYDLKQTDIQIPPLQTLIIPLGRRMNPKMKLTPKDTPRNLDSEMPVGKPIVL